MVQLRSVSTRTCCTNCFHRLNLENWYTKLENSQQMFFSQTSFLFVPTHPWSSVDVTANVYTNVQSVPLSKCDMPNSTLIGDTKCAKNIVLAKIKPPSHTFLFEVSFLLVVWSWQERTHLQLEIFLVIIKTLITN